MTAVGMRLTVIVCTRDRAHELSRCVRSVLASDEPDFQLLVVDQSDGDETERALREIRDRRLRAYRMSAVGKARGLNVALDLARGELLAFTDDDCTVPRDWLRGICTAFAREPEAGIVFGAVRAGPHDPEVEFTATFLPPAHRRRSGWRAAADERGMGANMAVRRTLLLRLGGFDEWVGPGSPFRSGDDRELAVRALATGLIIVHDPKNVVTHWRALPYASGAARRVVRDNFYGLGALHARRARRGEPGAAYALLRLPLELLLSVVPNVVRRRPTGLGSLAAFALGCARGLRSPMSLRLPAEGGTLREIHSELTS